MHGVSPVALTVTGSSQVTLSLNGFSFGSPLINSSPIKFCDTPQSIARCRKILFASSETFSPRGDVNLLMVTASIQQ